MASREILGALDVIGAFVMLWTNQRITANAGLRSRIAQWALLRRFVYLSVAFVLFVLGIRRAAQLDVNAPIEAVAQGVLLLYIILFPILRATGWITQDMLTSDEPPRRAKRGPRET